MLEKSVNTNKNRCNNNYLIGLIGLAFFLSTVIINFIMPGPACSKTGIEYLKSNKNKEYYTENKKFIILKMSKNLKAYIDKKNQKVYYYYGNTYYLWSKGIWFDSKKLNGMFGITLQRDIPAPLRHGPILRVKRKNIPAGFAALKVPPQPVKNEFPKAATEHLYNLPLTLNGLVIYQINFNSNFNSNR